jgi:hypothetical protein
VSYSAGCSATFPKAERWPSLFGLIPREIEVNLVVWLAAFVLAAAWQFRRDTPGV